MNPFLLYALKLAAVGIQIKASGLTDELRDRLGALNAELRTSLLAPKPDGTDYTDDDILALAAAHHVLTDELRARHQAPGQTS